MAHHRNYAYPLEVDWLCGYCHKRVHKYLQSIDWVDYIKRPEDEKRLPNMIQPKDLKHQLDSEVKDAMDNFLLKANFTNREKGIIKLRARGIPHQKIGIMFNITRGRIQQILIIARKKYEFSMKLS